AQVILPLLKTDFLKIINACAYQKLNTVSLEISSKYAVGIVCASQGYPDEFSVGYKIYNLDQIKDCLVFHAGTKREGNDILTSGGRVLTVVGLANTMQGALEKALAGAQVVDFENKYYRKDIGSDLLMMM
ncbi:MAG: phosphoribosylglycinamide synthetase C domain-containing protein, partial [Bacteroidia bacterium]|nr:phosphoribosylamine--glycine ligase [Bacteroidia bacterium]MDW8159749.1 phosphoribosylglycinamide synthetase C domain-containing protein [Bacteroidia bacterium]